MTNARMGEWTRVVTLVAAAVALSAAHPKEAAGRPSQTSEEDKSPALKNGEAPSPQQSEKASQHDQPCAAGYDNRSSDLCAQWKAADAAKLAADATLWFGIVGSLIGAATFAAAVAAAIYAKEAARHTEAGAIAADKALAVTREVAAAELRAWVIIKPRLTKFIADENGLQFHYSVAVENIGQTAARDLFVRFEPKLIEENLEREIDQLWAEWKNLESAHNRTLMPGEEHVRSGYSNHNAMFIRWRDSGKGKPRRVLWVLVAVAKYWSAMDNQWHRTERSFTVGDNLGEGFVDHQYIPENLQGSWEGPSLDVQVVMSDFRAGETS